jgi:hypothetical protein
LLCPFVFSLFVLIPVRAIPGNDLKFQLSIFTLRDYAVLIALTLLIALSLTMQMYLFRRTKTSRKKTAALSGGVTGVAGSFSGVLATVFATASCSSCAAALLGFLGSGAVLFLVENRWWMTLATTTLLLISLYVSAKKVLGVCVRCEISLSPNRSLPKEERALRSSKRT